MTIRVRVAALLLTLLLAPPLLADETVELQVWAIRATTKNAEISPELRALVDELKKSFKYTGYTLVNRAAGKTKVGGDFDTRLSGAYGIQITPDGKEGARVRLKICVTRKEGDKERDVLRSTVTIERGKFQLLGGWKLDGDDVLIAAVSAR